MQKHQILWRNGLVLAGLLAMGAAGPATAQMTNWTVQTGNAPGTTVAGAVVTLEQAKEGSCTATGPRIPVTPGTAVALSFRYAAESLVHATATAGLNVGAPLTAELIVTVTWLDKDGADVDVKRALQGFPAEKRLLILNKNSPTPLTVADNLTVPTQDVVPVRVEYAQVSLTLKVTGEVKPAKAQVSGVTLAPGQVTPQGLDAPDSGPADAGPLSTPPAGCKFAENLVPNGALEEGGEGPTGWKILGDNSQGAAVWKRGGAYSGKHCFQIFDRGPFVKSWDNKTDLFMPPGPPNNCSSGARDEVQARFASAPVAVEPGAFYQAFAMVWWLTHQRAGGIYSPVRIQFLDAQGQVLPYECMFPPDDQLPEMTGILPGWQFALFSPVPAPANAKFVRVVVALLHATYHVRSDGQLMTTPQEKGFVLVDNIALYRVPLTKEERDKLTYGRRADAAFRAAANAGLLPHVPTSPAHRPHSLRAESWTECVGGILTNAPQAGQAKDLSLHLENLWGDRRPLEVRYDLVDWEEKTVYTNTLTTTLEPFADTKVALVRPATLPYGPYLLRYTVMEAGQVSETGETRFAVLRPSRATYEEKERMDYPFSMWGAQVGSIVDPNFDAAAIREIGELQQWAGVGKQPAGQFNLLDEWFVENADPRQRAQDLAAQIDRSRRAIQEIRRYGMHPIVLLICPGRKVVPPAKLPIVADSIRQIITALKDDIHLWGYGGEDIHDNVDLDQTTKDGSTALSWGRQGSTRQWWQEYLVAYDAAKQADPTCLFGPFTCCSIGRVMRDFFREISPTKKLDCYEENLYFDAFACFGGNYAEFQKAGLPDLPVFAQEFAVVSASTPPTGPGHVPAEATAAANQTTYWVGVMHSFPGFCYGGQTQLMSSDHDVLSDLVYLHRARPQYVAFANMTDCLGAGKFTAKYEIPGGLVFVRERAIRKGIVGVLWSTGKEAVAELEVGAPSVELSDLWGNRRTLKAKKGVVTIPLTPLPQYVLGAKVLKPAPSVKLTLANTSLNPRDPQVTVTVVNERKEPLAGSLTLIPESAIAVAPAALPVASIPGGATRTFTFHVTPVDPDSDKPLALRARFITPQRTYEAVDTPNFHFALRVATPPVIDGNLAEWGTDAPFVADRADQVVNWWCKKDKPWAGPQEFSGRLWMRWDDKNLYLAARVQRLVFMPAKNFATAFASDAIEMCFNLEGRLQSNAGFTQVVLCTLDGKSQVLRYSSPGGVLTNALSVVKRTGQETVYEAAIPWTELSPNYRPGVGATISTVFGFDEADEGMRTISWYHTVSPHDPATFGRVRLVEPSAPGATNLSPTNLLENGTFDEPGQKPGVQMEGWTVTGQKTAKDELCGKAYLTTGGAYQGRSLCLERTSKEGNGMSAAGWTVPVKPGELYLVRAQVKTLGNTALFWLDALNDKQDRNLGGMVWIKTLAPGQSGAGNMVGLDGNKLPDRNATYAPMAAVFEVPAQSVWLRLTLCGQNYSLGDGDKVDFDNVELYRLTPAKVEKRTGD